MRRLLLLMLVGSGCGGSGPGAEDDGGGAPRRCEGFARPADAVVELERVFPRVTVPEAVDLLWTGERWLVASKPGIVYAFEDRPDATAEVYVDISDHVATDGEAGLLALAVQGPYVYLSYTSPGANPFRTVVSRIRGNDVATEEEIFTLDQPYTNHNGGDIAFGPDGYLYLSLGDGGAGSDPQGNGQNTDTLLGSILRLDVSGAAPYAIPPDNPFAGGGGRPEIFAYGLRNPWRFTFDRVTGDLWAGDVGQNLWEEVDLVRAGGNYGWNLKEGAECFGTDACPTDLREPVVQYRNIGAASVVGGFVYRGTALPDLVGEYIYSDFYLGTLWGVREGGEPRVLNRGGAGRFAAYAEDPSGELLGVSFNDGFYRLVAARPSNEVFPALLSQTGCVDPEDPEALPDRAIAYEVNVPFWSDGADKSRFAVVPAGQAATVDEAGDLDLPAGTVLVKSFTRDGALVETRLLVKDDSGWAGYSYAWRDDGTDADVVLDGRVTDAWIFPDGAQCDFCHTTASGGSLGLVAGQLDRDGQLQAFVDAGVLDQVPPSSPYIDPFGDAPLEARARAYLQVNCAQCHQEDGPSGRAAIDLRASTPISDMGICDQNPRAGNADVLDGRLVVPGDPARSILLARMSSLGSTRMPPVGSKVVDTDGVALIEAWIASLDGCP